MWNWDYTNVNNNFFEVWSPELAYIIGLFIADGYISDYENCGKKNVVFSNNVIDIDMIEKIANVVGYKNRILKFKSGMCRIQLSGNFVWKFFKDLGFDNHKTTTSKIPEQLLNAQELHPHLIRGIFDGDGSVSIRNRKMGIYPSVNIVGTYAVIEFVSSVYTFYNSKGPHKNVYRINYEGKNAVQFMNHIYNTSSIHMNRKYDKFLQAKNWKTPCERWSTEDKLFVVENYHKMYAKDISKIIGRTSAAVRSFATSHGLDRLHSNGKI